MTTQVISKKKTRSATKIREILRDEITRGQIKYIYPVSQKEEMVKIGLAPLTSPQTVRIICDKMNKA